MTVLRPSPPLGQGRQMIAVWPPPPWPPSGRLDRFFKSTDFGPLGERFVRTRTNDSGAFFV